MLRFGFLVRDVTSQGINANRPCVAFAAIHSANGFARRGGDDFMVYFCAMLWHMKTTALPLMQQRGSNKKKA